jgi:hypothetical protein
LQSARADFVPPYNKAVGSSRTQGSVHPCCPACVLYVPMCTHTLLDPRFSAVWFWCVGCVCSVCVREHSQHRVCCAMRHACCGAATAVVCGWQLPSSAQQAGGLSVASRVAGCWCGVAVHLFLNTVVCHLLGLRWTSRCGPPCPSASILCVTLVCCWLSKHTMCRGHSAAAGRVM